VTLTHGQRPGDDGPRRRCRARGNDVGDSQTVTVKVYSGGTATGTPVRQLIATAQADASYSVDASPALTDGTYTAQTEQTDANGNVGRSSANTFSVDTAAPAPTLVAPPTEASEPPRPSRGREAPRLVTPRT
jgi:hypothetical protein